MNVVLSFVHDTGKTYSSLAKHLQKHQTLNVTDLCSIFFSNLPYHENMNRQRLAQEEFEDTKWAMYARLKVNRSIAF